MATEVIAAPGVRPDAALHAALMASLADETPEGRSIVRLRGGQGRGRANRRPGSKPIPFSAVTRISGLDAGGSSWRKGAVDAIIQSLACAASRFRPR
ncbi:MAG: hypothetical protein WDM92_07735 [Caulobacteraceae bacterium]